MSCHCESYNRFVCRECQERIDKYKKDEDLKCQLDYANGTIKAQESLLMDLQRIIVDQQDKLRRIAGVSEDSGLPAGYRMANISAIASGPLGPDFRGMCKEAAPIIRKNKETIDEEWGEGTDEAAENSEWLKEYEEAIK